MNLQTDSASKETNLSSLTLKILGGRIDSVSLPQIFSIIEKNISQEQFLQIITANSLMLLETEKDIELQMVFQSAGLVIAESAGIFLLAKLMHFHLSEKIPGIDLMILICEKAEQKGWPIYLLGSKPGIAELTKNNLQDKFPNLKFCGTAHGYFNHEEEKRILSEIQIAKPKILFVGLGVPFQEKWIYRNAHFLKGMCVMGVGGSFDVISGTLRRAPKWMQKIGLEWLFRAIQEPWRWGKIIRLPLLFYKTLLCRRHQTC